MSIGTVDVCEESNWPAGCDPSLAGRTGADTHTGGLCADVDEDCAHTERRSPPAEVPEELPLDAHALEMSTRINVSH
jgi:hypothetical protein